MDKRNPGWYRVRLDLAGPDAWVCARWRPEVGFWVHAGAVYYDDFWAEIGERVVMPDEESATGG
jgi:hypothetical protein